MKIVFAASEAAPFLKTGGLGDVAAALPEALARYKGNEVLLFLPYYGKIKQDPAIEVQEIARFETALSWRRSYVGLYRLKSKRRKLRVYFIDNEQYFGGACVYGRPDDGERFAYFCKAILESLVHLGECPDIIHCNDWQTALLPAMLHAFYGECFGSAKTVFTIHNIEYQGWAEPYFLCDVTGLPAGYESAFAFHGAVNLVKGAILGCDALTTVSRTYAEEICTPRFAHGLSDVICDHGFKLFGIVNGIDMVGNDPATDRFLVQHYTADDPSGKAVCKAALQKELGLAQKSDTPLIGLVSRLVSHKGLDILCDALEGMLQEEIQFVVLGTGDDAYEARLAEIAARYPDKMAAVLRFSISLASRVYAASDLYMMPSKSEPCGLSQMMAMRYGAVPIVHETGGLKDTVIPFDPDTGKGLGFTFARFAADDLFGAFRRATTLYRDRKGDFAKARENGMRADFSWDRPALDYMALYQKLKNNG